MEKDIQFTKIDQAVRLTARDQSFLSAGHETTYRRTICDDGGVYSDGWDTPDV